ncbi:hypothetical protein LAV_00137 [Sphingobium phage Lacusarx]|uniref:Uncharacterized protein n=1 Tax=Sphingobium phage Lacusarx TaxID=1980139 RepID=A0A1W6DXL9_9CAUD|nr:hypothetical protein FDH44_gp166 [Sphingobium phage Lacusarx]ARK07512.1 hypothetical protein LAV_00137 [Sphingobium phage Lacusarx]
MTIQIPITQKMGEAIMWTLAEIGDRPDRIPTDPTDPLLILLSKYDRSDIMATVEGMWEMAYGDWISEPLTDLQKDVLRVSVEQTSWITAYYENELIADKEAYAREARSVLRDLASRLENLGIEVNHIPDG